MSVQSLFARISSLVIDHSLKNMDKPSSKRRDRFSLSPKKATKMRRTSRQNRLPQSELLETRTLLAAPQISDNGGGAFTVTGHFEDAWRNPIQSPTDFGTNTPLPNSALQYAHGNPLYFGVILDDGTGTGTDRLYPVPFRILSAFDSDGLNSRIFWDVPSAGNPTFDGDASRAFSIISANSPFISDASNPDQWVRPNRDDYARWNGFAWVLASLNENQGAIIANDHFDNNGDDDGGGVFAFAYYSIIPSGTLPTSNPFDDTDVFDLDGDGISEAAHGDNFDVDGDIYTGTDSDDGGDFNFENQSSLTVTVRARSLPPTGAIQSDSIAVTFPLRDVNDAPFIPVDFDDAINVFYISERLGQGEFVGDLVTWDEDNTPPKQQLDNSLRNDPVQLYEIEKSPQVLNALGAMVDVFEISSNTGEISINNEIDVDLSVAEEILAAYFDYETLGDRRDAPAALALPANPSDPFYIDNGYIYMDVWGFIEDRVQDDWFLPLTVRVTDFRNLSDPLFDGRVSLRSRDTVVYIGILDASEYAPLIPEDQLTLSINENTPSNDISNRTIGTITPDPQVNTFFIDTVANAGDIVTGDPTDAANYGDRDQFYTFAIDPATNPGGAFIVVPQVDPVSGLAKSAEIRVGNVNAIDFEQRSTFTISLIVTDVGLDPLSTRVTVTVNVDDLNEATTLPNTTFTLAENTAKGALVGTVNATDIDILTAVIDYQIIDGNQAIILIDALNKAKYEALLPSGGPLDPGDTITFQDIFTLDPVTGVVRVSQNVNDDYIINGTTFNEDLSGVDPSFFLDFEVTPTFNLILRATDSGNPNPGFSSDDATITINLTDVIEGEPTVDDADFIINENVPNGTLVGTVVGTPGQDSIFPVLFSIAGGNTGNAFSIDPNNGQLLVNNMAQINFEATPLFTLTIQVTDSSNPASFVFGTVTVTLNDVSEPVTIVGGQTFNVDENAPADTVVGTVAFNEPDNGQTNAWQIIGGNTGGTFKIDAVTGEISVNTNDDLDFELIPQFFLIIKVTDSGDPAFSDSSLVTINVNDIEPEPPIIDDLTTTLDEFSPAGTVVATVVPDSLSPGQTATFAIIGGDPNGDFAIDPVTGEITVVSPLIDFDDTPTFALIIEATDNAPTPLSDTATVTVDINNLNFSPVVLNQTFGLLDTVQNGDSIGFIAASDVDDEDLPLSFFIASNFSIAGVFAVDPVTGEITVLDNTNLPAAPDEVTFDITVSDISPTPDAVAQITMAIREPNDPPVINDVTFSFVERSTPGTTVGTVAVTDPNAGQTHTFSITVDDPVKPGRFVIDPATGEITLAGPDVIDFSRDKSFTLTVEVVDNGIPSLSDTAVITIDVLEFNGPIQLSDQEQLLLELINRARLDPVAEAARLGLDAAQTAAFVSQGTDAVQALAANEFLARASRDHSIDMLTPPPFFSHINRIGDSFDDRAFDAGYDFNLLAENLDILLNQIGLDPAAIQSLHDRMILDPVKRLNLLDGAYREFGAGIRDDAGQNVTVVTDLLGRENATGAFITGIVFNDNSGITPIDDDFYSLGEAIRSGRVRAINRATGDIFEREIGMSGAFSLRVPDGTYDITIFGGGLGADTFAVSNVVVNSQNVKVDFDISAMVPLLITPGIVGFEDGNWWVSTQDSGTWQTSFWGQFPVTALTASVSGDFNGDGVDDVAGWTADGTWYLGIAQFNGTLAVSPWNGWQGKVISEVFTGDFNGDGRADLLGRDSNGFWWVAESQGNTFTTRTWAKWKATGNWNDIQIGDFNNDGKDDIASRRDDGRWWVAQSDGTEFQTTNWGRWNSTSGWQDVSVGDFNGDGLADITGRTSSGRWWTLISQGNTFTSSYWGKWSASGSWSDVVVGDFNGDGNDDIAGRRSSGAWWAALSQGNSFTTSFLGQWKSTGSWDDVAVADFNEDGKDDIAGRRSNGTWWNALSDGNNHPTQKGAQWDSALNWSAVFVGNYLGPAVPVSPPVANSAPAFGDGGQRSSSFDAGGPALVYEAGDSSGDQSNQNGSSDSEQSDSSTNSPSASAESSVEETFGDQGLLDLLYQV